MRQVLRELAGDLHEEEGVPEKRERLLRGLKVLGEGEVLAGRGDCDVPPASEGLQQPVRSVGLTQELGDVKAFRDLDCLLGDGDPLRERQRIIEAQPHPAELSRRSYACGCRWLPVVVIGVVTVMATYRVTPGYPGLRVRPRNNPLDKPSS